MTEAKTKIVNGETVAANETKRSLVERLIAVKTDIGAVGKNDRNNAQGFNFRGIDAVINAVAGPFIKHGILSYPAKVVSVKRGTGTTAKGSTMNTIDVVVQYAFTDGSDTLLFEAAGEAFDSGDKATAKAMSVAYRTALLQALSLPTDEPDPDIYSYEADAVSQRSDAEVVAEFETITNIERLKEYWAEQRVNGRPKAVQDKGTARAAALKAQAEAAETP